MAGAKKRLAGVARAALERLPEPRDQAALATVRSLRDLVRGSDPTARRSAAGRALMTRLDRAYASGDPQQFAAAVAEVHRLRAHAERLATPSWAKGGPLLSEGRGLQSLQFMIDLLPQIQALMAEHERGTLFDILDVGPGTGVGTAMLAQMYRSSQLGYRARVSALDISTIYQRYLPTVTPHVPFIHQDVFKHDTTYDIVIASHVIEHLDDPVGFCRRLQHIARLGVFIACPFNEPADRLTRGHVRSVDDDLVRQLQPSSYVTTHSVSWGAFADPPYQVLLARLPGLADGPDQRSQVPIQLESPISIRLDSAEPAVSVQLDPQAPVG